MIRRIRDHGEGQGEVCFRQPLGGVEGAGVGGQGCMACLLGRSGWSEGCSWRSAGDWTGGGRGLDLCSAWLRGREQLSDFPQWWVGWRHKFGVGTGRWLESGRSDFRTPEDLDGSEDAGSGEKVASGSSLPEIF